MMGQVLDLQNERILVTGSGGVLGTAILKALQDRSVATVLAPRRAECDLLDAGAVQRVWEDFGPTLVFHLAGWVAGVQGNLSFAGKAFYENTCINVNVIEASRKVGVRKIVAAGTAAIYSDDIPLPMREDDVWRGAPHGSEGAYAHAKRAMLAQLEAYRTQYGLDFGYMIATNLYGENDRFDEKYGHVVPSLIARFHRAVAQGQREIVVWGDGSPTRDFLFSDDAAGAFLAVAEKGQGSYNTATGAVITIRDLVETLQKVSGFSGEVVWDTSKPKGQQTRSYDVSRLQSLGWSPKVGLEEGLKRTFRWYNAYETTARR
jgi:GDP-L-fucose synthase